MGKVRDAKFDTLKGFLILSVVFGHFFTHDVVHSASSMAMANLIYFFHMPLFVFVSGYFTSNQKIVRGGVRILETYIVFQLIKGIWLHYSILDFLIKPGPMLWYLYCLFFWRLLYAGMCRIGINVSWKLIVALILLSAGAGYIPWIGRSFALGRFIYYLPYFFLGILLQKTNIIKEINSRVSMRTAVVVMAVTAIISCILVIYPVYSSIGISGADHYPSGQQWLSMIKRVISYATATVVSIAFIRLFSFDSKLFGTIGKDSLKYYMFHGICLMTIEALGALWSTPFDITYASLSNHHSVTLISFLAPIYALVFTVLIYFFNKTRLSDFLITPISYIINQLKQKEKNGQSS